MVDIWYFVGAVLTILGGWKSFMNYLELRAIPAGPRRAETETLVASMLRQRKRESASHRLAGWAVLLVIGLGILIWKIAT